MATVQTDEVKFVDTMTLFRLSLPKLLLDTHIPNVACFYFFSVHRRTVGPQ